MLLQTAESKARHQAPLAAELAALGCDPARLHWADDDALIPKEMTPGDQWAWFERLLDSVDPGDSVVFDFTHGMRSVPIVFSSAIGFLVRAKEVRVEHVLYGWYDELRPEGEPHPIVDMAEFYAINDWADAVGRLTEDADARGLARLASAADIEALRGLSAPALVAAFNDVTDCIRNVDVNNIGAKVSAALERVQAHREGAAGAERVLLDLVWQKFEGLAFALEPGRRYDPAYLKMQAEIVAVLLEHRLFMQAFTAMRECIGSVGMLGLEGKYATSLASRDGRRYRKRFAEVFVNLVQYAEGNWKFEGQAAVDAKTLEPWYRDLDRAGAVGLLKRIANKEEGGMLIDYRNGFDHAWTSKAGAPADVAAAGAKYLETLREAIGRVEAALAARTAASASAEARFLNLSNHPIESSWSAEQVEAARQLGHGDPAELEGGLPLVPPEADLKEVQRLAEEVAERAAAAGATGAFVSGEYAFFFSLVKALSRRAIQSYVATTHRESNEALRPDGSVEKHQRFRFFRWRPLA